MKKQFSFLTYEPGVQCHTVATHFNCHPEEAAGIVSLKYHGDVLHPGITDAIENKKFLFVDAGITSYQGKSWRQWHKEGVVFIGTMGGPYDEHYLPDDIRTKECSATLIAKALDLTGPEYKKMYASLLIGDREGDGNYLSFSSHIRNGQVLQANNGTAGQIKMLEYAMKPFEWIFQLQDRFTHETSRECKKNASVDEIQYLGRPIRLALIKSDDPQMSSVAKSSFGVKANVVICYNSKGQVYISTSNHPFIDLSPVAKELNIETLFEKGLRYDPNDPRLEAEGSMIGAEEWHFQKEAQRIFSGSHSAPNKPCTNLKIGRIYGIVYRALKYAEKQAIVRSIAS